MLQSDLIQPGDEPAPQPVLHPAANEPGASEAPASPKTIAKKRWSLRPGAREVSAERYEAIAKRASALLCVDGVTVSFDGFKALDNLTLILDEGELRCIIGPNGAGKTTLMDVITGKTRPDTGSVFMVGADHDRRDLTQMSEYEVAQLGIGRKFQRPTVFHDHTVWENLDLSLRGTRGVFRSLFSRTSAKDRERIEEILVLLDLQELSGQRAGVLSHGQKQWLEIGMLLAQSPKILLVDEPVAGLTHQEAERTAELLKSLAGKHTVVVVEHDMDFVRSIANRVTVLHEGRVLAEGSMEEVQADKKVIEVYLGE
jgi:urea transport system ATP-binding protein